MGSDSMQMVEVYEQCAPLLINVIMSTVASIGLWSIIPKFKDMFINAGLSGVDMNKAPIMKQMSLQSKQKTEVSEKPVLYVCYCSFALLTFCVVVVVLYVCCLYYYFYVLLVLVLLTSSVTTIRWRLLYYR